MSKILLAQLFNPATGKKLPISSADVYDISRKKSVDEVIDEVLAKLETVPGSEAVTALETDLTQLKATFNTFMTGEDDDNGAYDRLKELVAAIQANRTSIDALLLDKATKAELEAVIERIEALEAAKDYTGIAYVTSTDAEVSAWTGKLKIVLQEIDTEATEETVEA